MNDNQYRYNQPMYNPQAYPQQQPFYPPPPIFVPTPIQENGVPITPFPEERKWIKHFYNWTGGMLLIHIGLALLMFVLVCVVSYVAMFWGTGVGFFEMMQNHIYEYGIIISLATGLSYVIANLLIFGIGCKVTKIKPKSLFKFGGFSGKLILGSIAIALFVQTIVQILSTFGIYAIQDLTGFDLVNFINKLTESQPDNLPSEIIMAVYACIGAPITEELLFRGFCLKNLSRINQRFGIIASALLFGLVHGNIIQFCLAFPLGILLAYITIKANSIIPAIIVHFTVNTSATVLGKIAEINETLGNNIAVGWYIATFVIGLIVLIVALTAYKQRLPKNTVPKKKRSWPLYFTSAPLILYTCLYGIMIILPLAFIPFLSKLAPMLNSLY